MASWKEGILKSVVAGITPGKRPCWSYKSKNAPWCSLKHYLDLESSNRQGSWLLTLCSTVSKSDNRAVVYSLDMAALACVLPAPLATYKLPAARSDAEHYGKIPTLCSMPVASLICDYFPISGVHKQRLTRIKGTASQPSTK